MIHGGAVRLGNLIPRLAELCDLSVLVFVGGTDDPEQRAKLGPYCRHVFFQQVVDPAQRDDTLPELMRPFAADMVTERISALVHAHRFDVVQLEYAELAPYASPDLVGAPVILTEHDLAFFSAWRRRRVRSAVFAPDYLSSRDLLRMALTELAACRRADEVHVMSDLDGRRLSRLLPDGRERIQVVPNGVDLELFRPDHASGDVLFVGSFPHRPNLDGLHWFVAESWPRVRRERPAATLTVVGAQPPPEVTALDGRDGMRVLGEVADVAPIYRQHRVFVAPLRAGSGTRLKILEAMASGAAVVSTSLGVEGIDAVPGRHVVVADSAVALADAVARLLANRDERVRLAAEARQLVEQRYGWSAIAERLAARYRAVAADSGDDFVHLPSLEVSVVIIAGAPGGGLQEALDALVAQPTTRDWEVIVVAELAPAVARMVNGVPIRQVLAPPAACWAWRANLGARSCRGRALIFLDDRVAPRAPTWLDDMAYSLFAPRAPAAVQGILAGSDTAATSTWPPAPGSSERSCGLTHFGVRRDIWEAFPFAVCSDEAQRWIARLERAHQLILRQEIAAAVPVPS